MDEDGGVGGRSRVGENDCVAAAHGVVVPFGVARRFGDNPL